MYYYIYVRSLAYELIVANHLHDVNKLKIMLKNEFAMKDLSVDKNFLGIEIQRDGCARKLWCYRKIYVKKVLDSFSIIRRL